jgi:hypothetical protein
MNRPRKVIVMNEANRSVLWTSLLPLLVSMVALGGCRRGPCDDGLQEGERFQITVLSDTRPGACEDRAPSLSPGDVFTLVAGPAVMQETNFGDGESGICTSHGALVDSPPFATDALTSCATDAEHHQLGLMCTGADAASCRLSVTALINSEIPVGAQVVDHAVLWMTWVNDCEPGSCLQLYDVRIDRPDMAQGQ